MFKNFFALVIIICFIISLSPVSANDNQNITKYNSFSDLNSTINNVNVDEIKLVMDYKYNESCDKFYGGVVVNRSLTVDGQGHVIDGDNSARIFKITSHNVTLKNITFMNAYADEGGVIYSISNNLTIYNCTFINNYAKTGGVIHADSTAFIQNSNFVNNSAERGGAVYSHNTNLTIDSCQFIKDFANSLGGGVVCDDVNLTLYNTGFINTESKKGEGGGLYLLSSNLNACNLTLSNSCAFFGAAITALDSKLFIFNSSFKNNSAKYCGGAVYQIYGSADISSTDFIENTALNGAGLFVDGADILNVSHVNFTRNSALNCGGAIYSFFNNCSVFRDINFSSSTDDVYNSSELNLTIGNGNYTMYVSNQTFNQVLPSYYNLCDEGHVTSVKNQKNGGNCWAFAALASLESCILKASGTNLDLSEQNVKNLMAKYSPWGYNNRYPNSGGSLDLAVSYLTGWLGPVLESDDIYRDDSAISPVLESIAHVQNVLYLKRSNYTDNDAVKSAILNYGAVATSMYYSYNLYLNSDKQVYQYYTGNQSTNHAVVIVGWNDSVDIAGAPGPGAWIVKNSWGDSWLSSYNQNGYFYVSYYDTRFLTPDTYSAITFVLNDTQKFDKNYQYDVSGRTDYLIFENTTTVWCKNIYTSTDDEFLTGVSTYFEKNTTFELTVKLNGEKYLSENLTAVPGYWTIPLNHPAPLCEGDVFEVIFKLVSDGDVSFPISEYLSLNKLAYSENISFLSFDGENWTDLYDFEWTYPGHTYASQVACIKAFTTFMKLNSTVESFNITYDKLDLFNVSLSILDEKGFGVGNGNITLTTGDECYTGEVYNGECVFNIPLKAGLNNLEIQYGSNNYFPSYFTYSVNISRMSLDLNITISRNFNTALISFDLSQKVNETLTVFINDKKYVIDTIDGFAALNLSNLEYGEYVINSTLNSDFYTAGNVSSLFCDVKKTFIEISDINTTYNSGKILTLTLKDEFNRKLSDQLINITLNNSTFTHITDSTGKVSFPLNLKNSIYNISADYWGDDNHIKSHNSSSVSVVSSIILPNITVYSLNAFYTVHLLDSNLNHLNDTVVGFKIGNVEYYFKSDENGDVSFQIPLSDGDFTITVTNTANGEVSSQNISVVKRILQNTDMTIYQGKTAFYKIRLVSDNGEAESSVAVTLYFNGVAYDFVSDGDGYVYLNLKKFKPGQYHINTQYKGFKVSNTIIIKNRLSARNIVVGKGKNIKFKAKLIDCDGKVLINKKILFKFKGKKYKVKTNKKGTATLKIKNKYKSGKYRILIKYSKFKIYKTIKIKRN